MNIKYKIKGTLPIFLCFIGSLIVDKLSAQCDCAYPIIFVHGFTGDYTSFDPLYTNTDFVSAWGGLSDTYDAVLNAYSSTNAYGIDGIRNTADDDALFQFITDPNVLQPGCLYAIDFAHYWNQQPMSPDLAPLASTPIGESESNQSAAEKQGFAVGETIKAVLAANPDKSKVILAGHSMGGLASREYLQRYENGQYTWWADPSDPTDGHKVAKLITVGTPHRGSNLSGGGLGGIFGLDETSEATRDLRRSYACGFANLFECDAPYLFGGPEDPNVDIGWFKNGDIDCDGDYDAVPVTGLNIAGTPNIWNGTYDNPTMPLPTNIKYSYYSSESILQLFGNGDAVVNTNSQWIYEGGNGSINNYLNGSSVPTPRGTIDYLISDHIHSENDVFHTSQTADLDYLMTAFDEADYAEFAYEIDTGRYYAGFAQVRANLVPINSEYTGSADRTVDGDWYSFNITQSAPGMDISVTPHPGHAGRVDIYSTAPAAYTNPNATIDNITWASGTTSAQVLSLNTSCLVPGQYYLRITHTSLDETSWQIPYKFKIDITPCTAPTGLIASTTPLDATITWASSLCTNQYTVRYRALGSTIWKVFQTTGTSYMITGLLPDTSYEYQVSNDCGNSVNDSNIMVFSTIACPNNLHIPNQASTGFVPEGLYAVAENITSDGLIDDATIVTYEAGQSIELMIGFETELGAEFLAQILPCISSIISPNQQAQKNLKHQQQHDKPQENIAPYVIKIPQADGSIILEMRTGSTEPISISLKDELLNSISTELIKSNNKSMKHRIVMDMNKRIPGSYYVHIGSGKFKRMIKIVRRHDEKIRRRL